MPGSIMGRFIRQGAEEAAEHAHLGDAKDAVAEGFDRSHVGDAKVAVHEAGASLGDSKQALNSTRKFLDRQTGGARAFLRCNAPPAVVYFDFNPESVELWREVDTRNAASASGKSGSPAGATADLFKKSAAGTIKLSKLWLKGLDTKPRCDQILAWMSPQSTLRGQLGASIAAAAKVGEDSWMARATRPPVLNFSWGPPMVGLWYDVIIQHCTINFNRFAASGIPIRATINLNLNIQPSILGQLPTNPTSGGLEGRGRHLVAEGDNLQAIAWSNYGSSGRWRQIANANAIDDPLRVRPGSVVYLPNEDELSPQS